MPSRDQQLAAVGAGADDEEVARDAVRVLFKGLAAASPPKRRPRETSQ